MMCVRMYSDFLRAFGKCWWDGEVQEVSLSRAPRSSTSVVQCFLPMMRLIIVGAYTRRAENKSIRPAPKFIKTGGNIASGRLEMLARMAMGSNMKLLA